MMPVKGIPPVASGTSEDVYLVKPLTLHDLLLQYVTAHDVGDGYHHSLLRTVRKCFNSDLILVKDMDDVRLNRMLKNLSSGLSSVTVSNIRREVLTLWRYAIEEGYTDTVPLRVRKIKIISQPIEAWSHEELTVMLALAKGDETNCGGLAQPEIKDWLPAWILIGYDTGLRFGDILGLTRSNIRNGSVCCTANKTGKSLVRKLSSDATAAALVLIKTSNDGSLFSGILTRRRAFVSWNHFLKRHQLRGSSKWLRRSCATYLDLNTPGSATNYLQHSSPALAMRHYIDQSLGAVPEGPPSIK